MTCDLKLNLEQTELLLVPGKDCPHMDLLVTVEDIAVCPSATARNLGIVLDNQLCCTANIHTAVARSCRFALYNIRRLPVAALIRFKTMLLTYKTVELPLPTSKR